MFRKLSFASSSSNVNKEKVKSLKQTGLASKSLSSAPDDLDDVAVISCNPDSQITYGSRGWFPILLLCSSWFPSPSLFVSVLSFPFQFPF